MNKNGLEIFVEELEDLIIREERNPSPKPPRRGRLWELSIITKSIEENLKYLKGYLAKEKYPKFKFICALLYVYNLSRLLKDEKIPKNYIPRLQKKTPLNIVDILP